MLFEKYKQFWETGDIEAFTSIIDPEIEIIMHSTGGVIDPDLWLERITAICPFRCICRKHKMPLRK